MTRLVHICWQARGHKPGSISTAILVLLAILAGGFPQALRAQWTKLEAPQLVGLFLWSVDFESPSLGYAIGSQGRSTLVYKTTDGGVTWVGLKGLGLLPSGFTFLDSNTGIASGRGSGCKCLAVTRTTDGGASWRLDSIRSPEGEIYPVQSSFGIFSMTFVDGITGFAAGANGTLLKSTDRGEHWARTNTGNSTDVIAEVTATTPERAYAVAASISNPGLPNILYRTSDGGQSWERIPDFIPGAAFGEIEFIAPEIGFVGGSDGRAAIYKTTDGGRSWNRKFSAEMRGAEDFIYGVEFQDQSVGYAAGSSGMLLRTTDGGESWVQEPIETSEVLQGISILNGVVHVVGSRGTILRRGAGASSADPVESKNGAEVLVPNPFTTEAMVTHPGLRKAGGELLLHDVLGRQVRRIVAAPGAETLRFMRDGLAPGTYLYRLMAGNEELASGSVVVR